MNQVTDLDVSKALMIAADSNMSQYSPQQLRTAATLLWDNGYYASADNIHIHLRLRKPSPLD
jgi:hypothetical protein